MKAWPLPTLAAVVLTMGLGCRLFHHRKPASGPMASVDNQFAFTVRAPYGKVAPMFGAWAERAWAGSDWNPRFLWPDPPQDREGMVFLVDHGHHVSTWVNTAFDLETGKVQYVYVLPGVQAVLIDIQLGRKGEDETTATVRYRRTALDARHNDQIRALGQHDGRNGPLWASQIEAGLKGK